MNFRFQTKKKGTYTPFSGFYKSAGVTICIEVGRSGRAQTLNWKGENLYPSSTPPSKVPPLLPSPSISPCY